MKQLLILFLSVLSITAMADNDVADITFVTGGNIPVQVGKTNNAFVGVVINYIGAYSPSLDVYQFRVNTNPVVATYELFKASGDSRKIAAIRTNYWFYEKWGDKWSLPTTSDLTVSKITPAVTQQDMSYGTSNSNTESNTSSNTVGISFGVSLTNVSVKANYSHSWGATSSNMQGKSNSFTQKDVSVISSYNLYDGSALSPSPSYTYIISPDGNYNKGFNSEESFVLTFNGSRDGKPITNITMHVNMQVIYADNITVTYDIYQKNVKGQDFAFVIPPRTLSHTLEAAQANLQSSGIDATEDFDADDLSTITALQKEIYGHKIPFGILGAIFGLLALGFVAYLFITAKKKRLI